MIEQFKQEVRAIFGRLPSDTETKDMLTALNAGEVITTPEDIFVTVCEAFRVSPSQLRVQDRTRELADIRAIYCYLARKYTAYPYRRIGGVILRDHATALYSDRKIATLLPYDKQIADDVRRIEEIIKERYQCTTKTE